MPLLLRIWHITYMLLLTDVITYIRGLDGKGGRLVGFIGF